MFCPNCGNDCGTAKFCVKCGTRIEQAEKSSVWSVGVPCPHCGGTQMEGSNCAFCGAQLILFDQDTGSQEKLPKKSLEEVNLREYYIKYASNRVAAIKKLHAETGIGIKKAKAVIDKVFDSYFGEQHDDPAILRREMKNSIRSVFGKK